ncbi:hypothetical protein LXL04_022875 [Taraxacum kok-saghyz]
MQYVIISRKGKPTSIRSLKLQRTGSSGVPGGMPFGLRHYTNVVPARCAGDSFIRHMMSLRQQMMKSLDLNIDLSKLLNLEQLVNKWACYKLISILRKPKFQLQEEVNLHVAKDHDFGRRNQEHQDGSMLRPQIVAYSTGKSKPNYRLLADL